MAFGAVTNHSWTVTEPTDFLYMGMDDDNFTNNFGQLSVTVTITTSQGTGERVHRPERSGPYQVAERQMLAKVPGAMVLPSSGTPMAFLYPLAVDQGQNNMGQRSGGPSRLRGVPERGRGRPGGIG